MELLHSDPLTSLSPASLTLLVGIIYHLINCLGINVYSDEEFVAAFHRVDKDKSGFITSNEVEELLFETYGYPALEEEIKMFMEDFDTNQDGKVSLDEFCSTLKRMRETLKGKDKAGCEYTSYN